MANGKLNANVPGSIDWYNSGIPTDPGMADLVGGGIDGEGMAAGTNELMGLGPNASTDLGMGPQGNMFGASSHSDAQRAAEEAFNYGLPKAVVMERNELLAIDEVEGFGETLDVDAKGIKQVYTRPYS